MIDTDFFRLLRYALGTSAECPTMTVEDWQRAFDECERQGVTAFVGVALTHAGNVLSNPTPDNRRAFRQVLGPWMNTIVICRDLNKQVSHNAVSLSRTMGKASVECCLLKGQGNAALYPDPESRTPGDIDMWMRRHLTTDEASRGRDVRADVRRVISLGRQMDPSAEISYHHIQFPDYHGTSVEAHYRPQFMFLWSHNRRLQRYFEDNANEQFSHVISLGGGQVAVPTPRFNAVFQLSHIFNHLFHEGIGMRQIIDYYYVITHLQADERRLPWAQTFSGMGLRNMCGAVMWILTEALGMAPELAIMAPDERRGRLVLAEIMAGGNFGQFDERYHLGHGKVADNVQRLWRDARLLRWFPSEALAEPFFRLWHYCWRLRHSKV